MVAKLKSKFMPRDYYTIVQETLEFEEEGNECEKLIQRNFTS
jgi:hypothetical protein